MKSKKAEEYINLVRDTLEYLVANKAVELAESELLETHISKEKAIEAFTEWYDAFHDFDQNQYDDFIKTINQKINE